MAFTVRDLEDLIRLLDKHPAWMEALRQRMLTKDLLESPKTLRRLSTRVGKVEEALQALTESIAALTEAQRRGSEEFVAFRAEIERRFAELREEVAAARAEADRRFAELAEAQRRTEERVGRLEKAVAALAEAQRRHYEEFAAHRQEFLAYRAETDRRFAELAEAQRRHYEEFVAYRAETDRRFAELREEVAAARAEADRRFAELAEAMRQLARRVEDHAKDLGELKPIRMELTFRQKPAAAFHPLLRRASLLSDAELYQRLEKAVEAGRIAEAEFDDALQIDLVVEGFHRREDRKLYLAVEVSWQGGTDDVRRAHRRAEILARALEAEVWPVVGAREMTAPARRMARALGVWWVRDGRAFRPEEIPGEAEEASEL